MSEMFCSHPFDTMLSNINAVVKFSFDDITLQAGKGYRSPAAAAVSAMCARPYGDSARIVQTAYIDD